MRRYHTSRKEIVLKDRHELKPDDSFIRLEENKDGLYLWKREIAHFDQDGNLILGKQLVSWVGDRYYNPVLEQRIAAVQKVQSYIQLCDVPVLKEHEQEFLI